MSCFWNLTSKWCAFPVNFNGHNTRTFGDTNKLVYFTMHIADQVKAVKKILPAMAAH